jgi:hypothetical protein
MSGALRICLASGDRREVDRFPRGVGSPEAKEHGSHNPVKAIEGP